MKKAYSDVVGKPSPLNKSTTYLNPAAAEFIPRTIEAGCTDYRESKNYASRTFSNANNTFHQRDHFPSLKSHHHTVVTVANRKGATSEESQYIQSDLPASKSFTDNKDRRRSSNTDRGWHNQHRQQDANYNQNQQRHPSKSSQMGRNERDYENRDHGVSRPVRRGPEQRHEESQPFQLNENRRDSGYTKKRYDDRRVKNQYDFQGATAESNHGIEEQPSAVQTPTRLDNKQETQVEISHNSIMGFEKRKVNFRPTPFIGKTDRRLSDDIHTNTSVVTANKYDETRDGNNCLNNEENTNSPSESEVDTKKGINPRNVRKDMPGIAEKKSNPLSKPEAEGSASEMNTFKAEDLSERDNRSRKQKNYNAVNKTKIRHSPSHKTRTEEHSVNRDNSGIQFAQNRLTANEEFKSSKEGRKFKDQPDTRKLRDPRMEREKLNKSEGSITIPEKGAQSSEKGQLRWSTSSCAESDREKVLRDKQFDAWETKWNTIKEYKVVHEIDGDLFEQPKDVSLAHCVAEDLRMGSGIAVSFKREFKNLPDLLDQRAKQGGLATICDEKHNRFVYYLVTKRESTGKPTYFTMWKALSKMRAHVKENEVKHVAIPRLGCGLDRLEWNRVKSMLEWIFKENDVKITVCNFQQIEQAQEKKSKFPLVIATSHITKIEPGTLILYFTTCKGDQDQIMRDLSQKINFLPGFEKEESKGLGDIIYFDDSHLNLGVCGCIVRENDSTNISYKSLHQCLQKINKKNDGFGADRFEYVATQWLDPGYYLDEELINEKIITMLTTFLRNVSVYICQGSLEKSGA